MEHSHQHTIISLNRAFIVGIVLNVLFVITEVIAGLYADSLGLLSDAGHNLSDVFALVLSLLAFRLARVHPSVRYTYGYKKSTVLVSLLNAVILLIAVGIIATESISKLIHPRPVSGDTIAWVAGVGVLINAVTALFFLRDKERDLNVKGAYLHMAADALVSVGVLVSGLLIAWTGCYIIDPIIGLLISVIIVISTWGLLRDSIRLSLDGVPSSISLEKVESTIRKVKGVSDVHHLHVWAISTTEIALTAHIVIADLSDMESLKETIKEQLENLGITHVTLEFETRATHCTEMLCDG